MKPGVKTVYALATALALIATSSCGKKAEPPAEEPTVKDTSSKLSKNPFTALQQLGEAAQKTGEKMQQAANRPPVEPVALDALTPFIGDIAGWAGEKPEGNRTEAMGWKMTEVSRTYRGEQAAGDAHTVRVAIVDGGFFPAFYAGFQMMTAFSRETLEGYEKGVSVDGHPAYEKWTKEGKRVELTLLVADRFLVTVRSQGLETAELHDWLGNLRLKQLADLK